MRGPAPRAWSHVTPPSRSRRTGPSRLMATMSLSGPRVGSEDAALGPVLVVELGDEDLDLLGADVVGVHERLRDPGHQAAPGLHVTRGLLDGHDRHHALLSAAAGAPG